MDTAGKVDLIASGYEFVCPECETYNRIAGIAETVQCYKCRAEFEILEAAHAYDKDGDALNWVPTIVSGNHDYAKAIVENGIILTVK